MSYARCGSDSDVYVYQTFGGAYYVHVAYTRDTSSPPQGESDDACRRALVDWLSAEYPPIGYSEDGKSSVFDTTEKCIDYLVELKDMGYRVPERCFERLKGDLS